MFDRSCTFSIPSPNLPLPSPHPPVIAAMAPEHPSSTRQRDNRSAMRPGFTSWRNLSLWSTLGLAPVKRGERHSISPSILLRPWRLRENPKQNSSAFAGPTPAPTLIPPNEVRWPDVLFLPVTTAAMKPLHTSVWKPRRPSLLWVCVCGNRCSSSNLPPPSFKRPKVSGEITKDQPSMPSEYPSVYDLSVSLRSADQNRTAFLIQCCHCSCCICLNNTHACTLGLHAQQRWLPAPSHP